MIKEETKYLTVDTSDTKSLSSERKLEIINAVYAELNCEAVATMKFTGQALVAVPMIVNKDEPETKTVQEEVAEKTEE